MIAALNVLALLLSCLAAHLAPGAGRLGAALIIAGGTHAGDSHRTDASG